MTKKLNSPKIPIIGQSHQFTDIPYYPLILKPTYLFLLSHKSTDPQDKADLMAKYFSLVFTTENTDNIPTLHK